MAKLDECHKVFVVQQLACFRTPQEVCELVNEEFGFRVTREQVRKYNPLQVEVAAKWQALFDATRERFLAAQAEIGISHQVVRLREYEEMFRRAKTRKNDVFAKEIMETVAKEVGGAFTNRRELTGKDGEKLSGVLVVPTAVDQDAWAKAAEASQASLPGAEGAGHRSSS